MKILIGIGFALFLLLLALAIAGEDNCLTPACISGGSSLIASAIYMKK